jgi:hypothetical protein
MQGVTSDREGYALAAGMALGLVALGKGREALGMADLRLEHRLRYAKFATTKCSRRVPPLCPLQSPSNPACGLTQVLHGRRRPFWHHQQSKRSCRSDRCRQSVHRRLDSCNPRYALRVVRPFCVLVAIRGELIIRTHATGLETSSDQPQARASSSTREASRSAGAVAEELAAAQGAAQVVLEGDLVDRDVTSPAAAIALGLMYIHTNDTGIASLFRLPGARYLLARVAHFLRS